MQSDSELESELESEFESEFESETESGSAGSEYARAREIWSERRAEIERTRALALEVELAEARLAGGWETPESDAAEWAWQKAEWEREQAEREVEEFTREWARVQTEVEAEEWVRAQVETDPEAEGCTLARARAEAVARALALAQEISMREISMGPLASAENERAIQLHSYAPPYAEVLADWNIKAILDSIKPHYRHGLARTLWRHSEHFWLIQIIVPATRLPPELLQSIFSTIIDDASGPPLVLMLVCKHWHTIVTGIWASLKLGTRTPRDTVARRNQWLLDIVVDTEIDRSDFTSSEAAYEAIFAALEVTPRWRSLVVETFPRQVDLPEHLVNRGLQRCSDATMNRLRSFKIKGACEMSPLLDHVLRIIGTTTSPELTTVEINSANVISFLVPAYAPVFRSVKVLYLNISGTHDPVDLLPHLHQLETLTASHLSLPTYGGDINLPFVNTLRHLTLRAVSIQWMSGRTFDVLESCTIIFPLHRHTLPIFSTTLPNCKQLTFQGYPLDILDGVSLYKIIHLSVICSGSFNRRGARQLVRFSGQVLREYQLALRVLHISIEATSQAWVNALTFMPHLEELVISSPRPSSLRAKVFQSLIVQPDYASNTSARSTPEEWDPPLCPSLRRFVLKYRRWLRATEHFDLIPIFLSVIRSRRRSNCALQSFSVWRRSDDEDPLKLVKNSRININGVERLAKESGMKRENVRDLMRMR